MHLIFRRPSRICFVILALAAGIARSEIIPPPTLAAIRANDNRVPAGVLENGVLTLHLEIRSGDWYPEADGGPSMRVDAFAEAGKAPQVPGPLIRVPQGTEIRVSFHNLLPAPAMVYGMHRHPGDSKDAIQIAPGDTREARFVAGDPGTYQYFASAGGPVNRGRPFREDSQLHGAFIIDPTGKAPKDRVFVLGVWRSELAPAQSKDVTVINGKSWPYTERLHYAPGQQARWRFINASDVNHPMHMHGSYYRVDSVSDGELDRSFSPGQQREVVTELIPPGSAVTATWTAVPGRWIFHCHLMAHVAPTRTVASALSAEPEGIHAHAANHMAGLVLGIIVDGERSSPKSQGQTRKLRLLVKSRPAVNGLPPGFSYQLEESHHRSPDDVTLPGPPIVLDRGRSVEITIENQMSEATAVHWHGMELQSYYDGVAGWGIRGQELTPTIEPGQTFCAKFTPPRAGTFIYHTHLDDEIQLTSGLYGPLIVVEPGQRFDPQTDQVLLISGWGGQRSANPEKPISALLNGSDDPPALHWKKGQSYRMRLINISSNLVGLVSLSADNQLVHWRARAKDGADLPPSQAVSADAKLLIAPGETYDFDFQPQESGTMIFKFEGTALPVKVSETIDVE